MNAVDNAAGAGRFLYADYTPFDENKNFLEMLKDLVSVSEQILRIKNEAGAVSSALAGADTLYNDLNSKFRQFRANVLDAMDAYNDKFNEILRTGGRAEGSDLFYNSKTALSKQLDDTEARFISEYNKYRDYLQSRMTQLSEAAVGYLQQWLLRDYYDLPYTLTSRMLTTIDASIDAASKKYRVSRSTTVSLGEKGPTGSAAPALLSYSFHIDSTELEFWNHKRKVSDLGLKDMVVPVGFKVPISEKLKRPFKLSRKVTGKEPDFVDIDSYYLVSVTLQENSTLTAIVAADPSKPDYDMIRIAYSLDGLYVDPARAQQASSTQSLPRIDYFTRDGDGNIIEESNVLQHREILDATDTSKILLFGRVLADRMSLLSDPRVTTPRSKLVSVKVDDKHAIGLREKEKENLLTFDHVLVVLFLESIAGGFSPIVSKLKQKSIAGELILRQELEGGNRREHVVRIADLRSALSFAPEGRTIASQLGVDLQPETKGVAYPS
jgi:hypothetical protein